MDSRCDHNSLCVMIDDMVLWQANDEISTCTTLNTGLHYEKKNV